MERGQLDGGRLWVVSTVMNEALYTSSHLTPREGARPTSTCRPGPLTRICLARRGGLRAERGRSPSAARVQAEALWKRAMFSRQTTRCEPGRFAVQCNATSHLTPREGTRPTSTCSQGFMTLCIKRASHTRRKRWWVKATVVTVRFHCSLLELAIAILLCSAGWLVVV